MRARAIRIHAPGGPEALRWEEIELAPPGHSEALVRHTAIGVNYIDVYHRTGLYPVPGPPTVIGVEAAGVVEAIGPGVTVVAAGERVAYASGPLGAYAERSLVPAERLVRLPASISYETAAAMMLKGLTTQYLLRRTYKVKAGDTILFHAAAGGVGLIACQWAKALGATVIGTVGTKDKGKLASEAGAQHIIYYRDEDFVARLKDITKGGLCEVAYDGVGKTTFPASLDCLKPFGYFVSFGSSSGPIDAFNIGILAQKGSLYATRPTMNTHVAKRDVLEEMARDLFEVVSSGKVKIPVHNRYKLAEARKALEALEVRETTGATVLIP